jgi:tetratricopeptide (TPR) repeat protein
LMPGALGRRSDLLKKIVLVAVLIGVCLGLGIVVAKYDLEQVPLRHWLKTPGGVGFPRSVVTVLKAQSKKIHLLEEGQGYFLNREYSAAMDYARKVQAMDKENKEAENLVNACVNALISEGEEMLRQGHTEDAFERATLARQFKPGHAETRELLERVADSLTQEAQEALANREYGDVVRKGRMVLQVRPDDRRMKNLFRLTARAYLNIADAYYVRGKYGDALLSARAAENIHPGNRRAKRLLTQITDDLDEPALELQGITKEGGKLFAIIYVPKYRETHFVKTGDVFRNYKVVSIDNRSQIAKVLQFKTQTITVLELKSKGL